jgi:hypothetical protein
VAARIVAGVLLEVLGPMPQPTAAVRGVEGDPRTTGTDGDSATLARCAEMRRALDSPSASGPRSYRGAGDRWRDAARDEAGQALDGLFAAY